MLARAKFLVKYFHSTNNQSHEQMRTEFKTLSFFFPMFSFEPPENIRKKRLQGKLLR